MTLTEQQLRSGISLLSRHVTRLAQAAKRLLGGDAGLAFSLWSIGVEEAAKLAVLRECLKSRNLEVPDWALGIKGAKTPGGSLHQIKFEKGLQAIGIDPGAVIGKSVKVRQNSSDRVQLVRNVGPDGQILNKAVSILPGVTGEFEDTSNTDICPGTLTDSPVSLQMRFDNFYVDYDAARGWQDALVRLESTEAAADISLSTSDLENFVERLADYAH